MVDPTVGGVDEPSYDGVMDEPNLRHIARYAAAAKTLEIWIDLLREDPSDASSVRLADSIQDCWIELEKTYHEAGKAIRKAALESIRR